MNWLADKIEQWPTAKLLPYARNARTHSEEQVAQIAASIAEFGFTNPILAGSDGIIVAGHGRLAAAQKLGLEIVPVVVLDHLSPTQRRALVIADTFEVLRARLLYGKGPLEPWRLATVYPANPTQLQLLKREQGNRCQSCGCELGRTKDDKANVVVLVRGNTRRQQLICGLCNVGFHTEALNHRKPPSTQKSG